MIPFNRPYLTGNELANIAKVLDNRKLSGDGEFTKKCQSWFEQKFDFHKTLLTTSCTDALEMCAILLNIQPGDEVIMPSYTFVSTANAFALRGATLVFADSQADQPNIDAAEVERLITPLTKAIVVVHYAGVACDMDRILEVATAHGIPVVEDAAQGIDSYHRGRPLGSLGALSAFSFHETKNVVCGEGGLLVVNNAEYDLRAEIIREKGTNRSSFFRGEVDKYGWVDVGSSFLPSDMLAAFLFAQLESVEIIQAARCRVWSRYYENLAALGQAGLISLPVIPEYATNNAHMFYLVCRDLEERTKLIDALKAGGVMAVFHYLSLHSSPYFAAQHGDRILPNSDRYTDCLVRLPLFPDLTNEQVDKITGIIASFYAEVCTS
ncbi:dTDP-4-amino-4,6-dideoxygalactose transaminase [Janthinobacterium sp. PSPC3-1]|uniref:dTDP-4-amino-4,6-dideoxygalactose transaminase n=1 Tax=Janthinobacterium sp. PSPC3-1 TaxID=2804653 RepID=UPI003CE9D466